MQETNLEEARTLLEAFDGKTLSLSSLEDFDYAFDLLTELIGDKPASECTPAKTLQVTYTRRLLEKMKAIDCGNEKLCIVASRLILMKAFPFAAMVCERDPTLATGYDAIRANWQEWGEFLTPLIGPDARRRAAHFR